MVGKKRETKAKKKQIQEKIAQLQQKREALQGKISSLSLLGTQWKEFQIKMRDDTLKWCIFLILLKSLVQVSGEEYLELHEQNLKNLKNIYKDFVFPLWKHKYSKDIQLLSIDWVVSFLRVNKEFWMKNLPTFIDSITDLPSKYKEKHLKVIREEFQGEEVDPENMFYIPTSKKEAKDDYLIRLKELLKSLTSIFDLIIIHGLFEENGNKNSENNRGRESASKARK